MMKSFYLAGLVTLVTSAEALNAYGANSNEVSVSGLSSGAFMSVQLGVAYSSLFPVGFGVFAGGPFDCARNQSYIECMDNNTPSITTPIANMKAWSGDQIDALSNLENRNIYLEVGSADTVVGPNPMDQLNSQLSNFANKNNVEYYTLSGQEHTFPTDFDGSGDNACSEAESPYISNCGFDGAGAVLQHLYGTLNAKNTGTLKGSVISFSQTGSYGAPGMDTTGYLFVPAACASESTSCKVHVALHGCLQSYSQIGSDFIDNTGYNMWADTNNIIIVYPQTIADDTTHDAWTGELPNPNACWDWVGWYGNNADQHGGVQMVAITNMVKQITSKSGSGGNPPPSSTFSTSTTKTTTTTTPPAASVTCAYAGEYVQCPGSPYYLYCYYYLETYPCSS